MTTLWGGGSEGSLRSPHLKHLASDQPGVREVEKGRVVSEKEEVADTYFPGLCIKLGGAIDGDQTCASAGHNLPSHWLQTYLARWYQNCTTNNYTCLRHIWWTTPPPHTHTRRFCGRDPLADRATALAHSERVAAGLQLQPYPVLVPETA